MGAFRELSVSRKTKLRKHCERCVSDARCSSASVSGRVVELKSEEKSSERESEGEKKTKGVHFSKINVPSSLRETQMSPQWEYWKAAMQEEHCSAPVGRRCRGSSPHVPGGTLVLGVAS